MFCFSGLSVAAQEPGRASFQWGVTMGLDAHSLGALFNPVDPAKAYIEFDRSALGWSTGVFGSWNLMPSLALRPQLLFAVNENRLKFYSDGGGQKIESYRFSDICVPVHLVISNRFRALPLRSSFLFGGSFSWNTAQNMPKDLTLYRERWSLDIGMGVEINIKSWRIKPEVISSHGLNNIHNLGDGAFDWVIGKMVRDRLSLRVSFWKEK